MLGLTRPTDPRWLEAALENLDAILVDHAHCEMKAASNALSLAVRAVGKPRLVAALAELAEEEVRHFRQVHDEIERRGLALGPPPVDPYAVELRRAATTPTAGAARPAREAALVDRLLVGALIEARSCERFQLLVGALRERGPADLHALYVELLAAEARHFRTFVDLAIEASGGDEAGVRARLAELAAAEGEICARLSSEPTVHG